MVLKYKHVLYGCNYDKLQTFTPEQNGDTVTDYKRLGILIRNVNIAFKKK